MGDEACTAEILPPVINKIDPVEFDVTISAILIGLGAERYIEIFKKQNIGQCTLTELTDEDLIKLGIDDAEIRKKLIEEVKNLPIYEDTRLSKSNANIDPMEIVEILDETSQHLYRIYLSMLANTLALKNSKKIADCLLHKDKFASDISLVTLSEITNLLNSMEISLHTHVKVLAQDSRLNTKKIIVGTVGSAIIIVLATLFARSLKQIN